MALGGSQSVHAPSRNKISKKEEDDVQELLERIQIELVAQDLGAQVSRKILQDL